MSFIDFLTEAATEAYEPITTEQLGILRQEVDRSALRIELNKKYIEKLWYLSSAEATLVRRHAGGAKRYSIAIQPLLNPPLNQGRKFEGQVG